MEPHRPEEIDDEMKAIIAERLRTVGEDKKRQLM